MLVYCVCECWCWVKIHVLILSSCWVLLIVEVLRRRHLGLALRPSTSAILPCFVPFVRQPCSSSADCRLLCLSSSSVEVCQPPSVRHPSTARHPLKIIVRFRSSAARVRHRLSASTIRPSLTVANCLHDEFTVGIGGFNQRQGEALPPQIFLTLNQRQAEEYFWHWSLWSGLNYRMMTFCYNDETSTKTTRTAAVFRHILEWILHVCLISPPSVFCKKGTTPSDRRPIVPNIV